MQYAKVFENHTGQRVRVLNKHRVSLTSHLEQEMLKTSAGMTTGNYVLTLVLSYVDEFKGESTNRY